MNQPDFESWLRTSFAVTGEFPEGRTLTVNLNWANGGRALEELTPAQGWQLIGHLCGLLTGGGPQSVSPVTDPDSELCSSCGGKLDLVVEIRKCRSCGCRWHSGEPEEMLAGD
jgi:hypothetical protein